MTFSKQALSGQESTKGVIHLTADPAEAAACALAMWLDSQQIGSRRRSGGALTR
jgi:hypothetical protein